MMVLVWSITTGGSYKTGSKCLFRAADRLLSCLGFYSKRLTTLREGFLQRKTFMVKTKPLHS